MTCEACDHHITHAVHELDGVIEANADYISGKAEVRYDKTKTSKDAIISAIDKTSYKVVDEQSK